MPPIKRTASISNAAIKTLGKDRSVSREKLLHSATNLFADRGYHGVSVRDIANDSKVNSALVGYYFGSKEGLLAEVYTRHFEPLKQERSRLLAEAHVGSAKPTLEQILEAFIRPSLHAGPPTSDKRSFYRLRAILSAENHQLLEQLVAQTFDESSRGFIDALAGCLPHLNREDIFWRFHFLLGAIYYSATGPKRIRILSGGLCDPSDSEATTAELIHCTAAMFRAPGAHSAVTPAKKKTHSKRKPKKA